MNIFDFDGTLYEGDSSVDFYKYNLLRKPFLLFLWPIQLLAIIGWKLHIISLTRMKQIFYVYLRFIDTEAEVKKFWKKKIELIYPWYYDVHRENDIVISASPEFLLRYPCEHLGISNLIASKVDPHTGKYDGLNCGGEEKLVRFREAYPTAEVECAYFDRRSDLYVSNLASKRILVYNFGALHEVPDDEMRDID